MKDNTTKNNLDTIIVVLVASGQMVIANILKKFVEAVQNPNTDQLDAAQKSMGDLIKACNSSDIWEYYKPKDEENLQKTYFSAMLPSCDEQYSAQLEVDYCVGNNVFITLTYKGMAVMHTVTRSK